MTKPTRKAGRSVRPLPSGGTRDEEGSTSRRSPYAYVPLALVLCWVTVLGLCGDPHRAEAAAPPAEEDPWIFTAPPLAETPFFSARGATLPSHLALRGSLESTAAAAAEYFAAEVAGRSRSGGADLVPHGPEWEVVRILESPRRTYVHLRPVRLGSPVLGPRITCAFTPEGELLEVKGRTLAEVPLSSAVPTLAPADGLGASLTGTSLQPEDVEWMERSEAWLAMDSSPDEGNSQLVPILLYQWAVPETRQTYESWVDARTGRLLGRESLVRHIDGKIESDVHPETPLDELERVPLGSAHVHLRPEDSDESALAVTDAEGQFAFDSDTGVSYVLRTALAGPRIEIRDRNLGYTTPVDSIVVESRSPAGYIWSSPSASASARDAFYHGNVAYSFIRSLDSGDALARLDSTIVVRVDDTQGTCNAFWDGTGLTFYAAGGICTATGQIADVVYHEYGHAVTTQIYRPFRAPRDMDEAFSDFFATTMTGDAEVGRGLYGQPGTFLRELETDRVWPEDANPTSPHLQGLILAGALWDLRELVGPSVADPLFHFARYALPESFDEFLLDLLGYDDDDGDLTNGTPHFAEIIAAFRPHGIGDYSVLIEAEPLPDVELPDPTLVARARVLSLLGLESDALEFHYRTADGEPFTTVPLEPGTGIREFVAQFDAPASGSRVDYYWSAEDTAGTRAVLPEGAPGAFLSFEVGLDLIAPQLRHDATEFLTPDQIELQIETGVEDNSGRIAEVRLDYGLEGQDPPLRSPLVERGAGIYHTSVPIGPLAEGSVVEYSITATDASLGANTATFPTEGTQRAEVRRGSTAHLEDSGGGLEAVGDWEWGVPSGVPSPPFGSRVWATGLDRNYSSPVSSALVWGPVEVDPGGPRRLEFLQYHDFLEGIDGGQIQVSTNGTTWSVVSPATGYGGTVVAAFAEVALTGRSDGWEPVTVALDRFPGSRIWVRWQVRTAGSSSAPGWYLDDLQIVSAQARISPNSLEAASGQSEQVPLAWRPPRGILTDAPGFLGYRIYRTEGSAPFPESPWMTGVRTVQLVDRDVENGITYRYRLHAVYTEGESPGVETEARPASPVFAFPVSELIFRLTGQERSDSTLVVRNSGEGILEFNAYLAETGSAIEDIRIRADVEQLEETPVTVFEDPADSPSADIAAISVYRTQGISGDVLNFEILGHENWRDPIEDFGGLLLLDTDLDLGTGPPRSVFGWNEDLNIGWDVGILFGKLARDQGGVSDALIFPADDLNDLRTLSDVSLPEDSNRITLAIPLADLGDPIAVDLSVLFSTSRLSQPIDRAPNPPDLEWLAREPRKMRIRPGEDRPFSLEFDATRVGNGSYEAQVYLTSNDPLIPRADLPVRLEVSGIVPVDLDTRSFRSLEDGLEVSFGTPRGLTATGGLIERSLLGNALWTVLNDAPLVPDEQGLFVFTDRTAVPRTAYDYRMRLFFEEVPGSYTFGPYEATYRPGAPAALALALASPNPFRESVDVRLEVPFAARARVDVFGVDGRRLATLLDDEVEAGQYPLRWEGTPGRGIYWVRAEVSGSGSRVLRLVQVE